MFEGKLNEMAFKEGSKTFLIPGALVLQMLAIQGSRLSTGGANLLENWVCFTKPNIFSCNWYSKKANVFIMHLFFLIFSMMAIIFKEEKYELLKVCLGYEEKLCAASPTWCLFCQMCPSPAPGVEASRCLTRTVFI